MHITDDTHINLFRAAEDGGVLLLKQEGSEAQAESLRELKRVDLYSLPVSSELLGRIF